MKQKLTLEETIQALNMTMPAQTGETPVPKNDLAIMPDDLDSKV